MKLSYKINGAYKYPNSCKIFILKKRDKYIFHFDCGHKCTDSVFMDLIDLQLNLQVYQINGVQLRLL